MCLNYWNSVPVNVSNCVLAKSAKGSLVASGIWHDGRKHSKEALLLAESNRRADLEKRWNHQDMLKKRREKYKFLQGKLIGKINQRKAT
jgi:hypothetical protein